jgi:hypothetical protein
MSIDIAKSTWMSEPVRDLRRSCDEQPLAAFLPPPEDAGRTRASVTATPPA